MYKANHKHNYRSKVVMLAYAGIQNLISTLDSRFHGKDNGILSSVTKGLCLSLLIISPHSIGATPGVTPGEFSVDASGSANYTVPIAVPPGTAGMQPSLTLSYNSRSGNGLLGVGWTLGGLSVITRCPRTKVIDGVVDGISLDGDDRFCIDGQRLIQVTGSVGDYGNNDIEYRTEVDGFTKVISKGTAGTGPEHFIAYTKSGQILEYGNTADSRIEAVDATTGTQSSEVRLWAVNKIEDTVGNYLTVTYSEDSTNGSYKPVEIAYTGFDNGTTISSPYNEVQFEYEARETIEGGETKKDEITLFFAGSKVKNTERLTNIKTYSNSTLVRDYQLVYDNDGAANRSRLTSITECDGQTTSNCFKPITFEWQDRVTDTFGDPIITQQNVSGHSIGSEHDKYLLGDFNGDGLTDVVYYYSGYKWSVRLADGNGGFGDPILTDQNVNGYHIGGDYNKYQFGDFNGDGMTDLVYYQSPWQWSVRLADGTGQFGDPIITQQNISGHSIGSEHDKYLLGDFNGDGLTDVVYYYSGYKWSVRLADGNGGFGDPILTDQNVNGYHIGGDYNKYQFGDFNGDGMTDLVYYQSPWQWSVRLADGTGQFGDPIITQQNVSGHSIGSEHDKYLLGDFNGDGLTDVVYYYSGYKWSVRLADGNGGFGDPILTDQNVNGYHIGGDYNKYQFGDFNGDGMTDLVYYQSPWQWSVRLADGTGQFGDPIITQQNISGHSIGSEHDKYLLGDFNGDGLTDVVYYYSPWQWSIRLSDDVKSDLITKITNSLGTETSITYASITDSSVYTKGSSAVYPEVDVQGPVYVVSKVTVDDGVGSTRDTDYSYTGAKSSLDGRGFLGFRSMTAVDSSTGIKTKTTYSQTHPYIGLVERTEQRLSNDDLIGEVDTTFAHHQTHTGVEVDTTQTPPHPGVLFPYASTVTKKDYEID